MFLRSSPLQLHTTLWSPSPQSLFNLINLIWCLIWTDRCSCPHWETVRLNTFKSILISLCLSGMKTLTHNLCSHVNIYTYTGLKLGCLQFLKRQQNYLSAQGAERERERGGSMQGNKRTAFLIQCADNQAGFNPRRSDKIAVWLPPISHWWSAVWAVQADKSHIMASQAAGSVTTSHI